MFNAEKWCLYQHQNQGNFTCGCCQQVFSAICQLHRHLGEHGAGGSYHYDHWSQTAFPKYDTVCAYVQTDTLTKSDLEETLEIEGSNFQFFTKSQNHNKGFEIEVDVEPCSQDGNSDEKYSDENNSNGDWELNRKTRMTYSKVQNEKERVITKRNAKAGIDKQRVKSIDDANDNENLALDINNSQKINTVAKKQKTIAREKMFKCTDGNCFAEFSSKKALRLHLAEHSGKILLSCDVCKRQFVHKPALQVHMRLHERDQVKETKETLTEEFEQCIEDKKPSDEHDSLEIATYRCRTSTCDAVLHSKPELKSHERLHKGKQFACSQCPKVFSTKQGLTFHSNIHKGTKFECDVCGKLYGHANTLKKHKVQHSLDTQYQCKVCDRHFAIQSLYKKHMTSHTREKQFTCEICGFQTHCNNILKAHGSTHSENQFKCEKCEKTFSRKAALLEHMHTHSGIKPYVCEYCAMSFAYQSSLVTHLRIHTGHRPYKCETCSRTFSLRHIYRRHLLTHTQERPYKCTVCGKAFIQEYNRSVHMRQHTGEKPFACEICARRFAQRCTLKNHMKSHYDNE